MRRMKVLIAALSVTGVVLAAPAHADEALAKKHNCLACHQLDKKVVGPAYKDIGKKYKGQSGAPAMLAEKVKKGGSGTWGPMPMPPNPTVPDADVKKLVDWILKMG
jgi:cytochrome c